MHTLHKKLGESSVCFEQDSENGKCQCPPGFKGDGVKSCVGEKYSHYYHIL